MKRPTVIIYKLVVVIAGILNPTQHQLPGIAHALDGLGPDLCRVNAGNNIAARMAMMAITTRSSISVKPRRVWTGIAPVKTGSGSTR